MHCNGHCKPTEIVITPRARKLKRKTEEEEEKKGRKSLNLVIIDKDRTCVWRFGPPGGVVLLTCSADPKTASCILDAATLAFATTTLCVLFLVDDVQGGLLFTRHKNKV